MNRSKEILACSPNPCYNGGTCALINGGTDYYCYCRPDLPLTGKNCDQRITTIATTTTTTTTPVPLCAASPCANSGTCTENRFLNTYTCTCLDYAYGNRCESECDIEMDEKHALCLRLFFSRYQSMLHQSSVSKWRYMCSTAEQWIPVPMPIFVQWYLL